MFECPNRKELLASEQRRRCANRRTDAPFGMNAYVFDFRQINSKKPQIVGSTSGSLRRYGLCSIFSRFYCKSVSLVYGRCCWTGSFNLEYAKTRQINSLL